MCKHRVKKILFIITYVPDPYKTQQKCNKAILENAGTLESILDWKKTQEMCDKVVDIYAHASHFPNSLILWDFKYVW